MSYRRGALLFFDVIHQIWMSHGLKNRWFESNFKQNYWAGRSYQIPQICLVLFSKTDSFVRVSHWNGNSIILTISLSLAVPNFVDMTFPFRTVLSRVISVQGVGVLVSFSALQFLVLFLCSIELVHLFWINGSVTVMKFISTFYRCVLKHK